MTAFIAETVSFIYDLEEDRLKLVCHDKEKKQTIALVTRHLLKNIMSQIPQWFDKQWLEQHERTLEQQQAISEFQHQAAQSEVELTKENIQIKPNTPCFLITSIDFTEHAEQQQISLIFWNNIKDTQVTLTLSKAQFHKVLETMLSIVPNWDIQNPWGNKEEAQSFDNKSHYIH